jgi:hypothetical protein
MLQVAMLARMAMSNPMRTMRTNHLGDIIRHFSHCAYKVRDDAVENLCACGERALGVAARVVFF